MKSWDITGLDLRPRLPEILSSTPEARAIALDLRAGGGLPEHEVHERAWVVVVSGEIDFTTTGGDGVSGGPGLVIEVAPAERHAVVARTDARLLLLLTPWPGRGHPGPMTMRQKLYGRRWAAKQAAGAAAAGGEDGDREGEASAAAGVPRNAVAVGAAVVATIAATALVRTQEDRWTNEGGHL